MQKDNFTLTLDQDNKVFYGTFTDIRKDLLQRLKDNAFAFKENKRIEHIMLELFPDTLTIDIVIEKGSPDEETYDINIYLNLTATEEMKDPVMKWKNRDIDFDEEDELLEISFTTRKDSPIIKKHDENELILEL